MLRNAGISKEQWRKDAPSLLLCCGFIALIPVAVLLARPRPLAADTPGELISLARKKTEDEALREMSRHFNSWSAQGTPDIRWDEIRNSIDHEPRETQEIAAILELGKAKLAAYWPLYVKRAWLNNQEVWLIAGSQDAGPMNGMWICPPSREDLRQESVRRFVSRMKLIIVSADAPYRVLSP